jgi:subtilisin family serine protease
MPDWTRKLSAGLSLALGAPHPNANSSTAFLGRGILPRSIHPGTPETAGTLEVFLRCDPSAHIELPGVHVCQSRGAVRTAQLPVDRIAELASHPHILHLTESARLKPSLDIALPLIRVPGFRHRTGASGKGVLIGIVDSGIDTSHPAFAGRVLMVWDQTQPGTGRGRFRKGRVLTGPELGKSTDENGHGTHVAGIAAGNDPVYAGVAPNAQLLVVKTTFDNTDIGNGIDFIFEEAARLGCPAVVNLSLGGHLDPHDGTDDLSALIDAVSGPGRIVVAAAGNEGQNPIHARVTLPPGGDARVPLAVGGAGPTPACALLLNGWYTGQTTCSVEVLDPAGNATPPQTPAGTDDAGNAHSTVPLGNAVAQIVTPSAAAAFNGDHQFIVALGALPGTALHPGTWTIRLRNTGSQPAHVDMWILTHDPVAFPPGTASRSHLVGSPGCATQAIAVGAFVSRNHWIDQTGTMRQFHNMHAGSMADFSSPGPRRDGHPKPDITAPGAFLVSCRSSDAQPTPELQPHPQWIAMPGTSMASPVVAGLVALLLESNPNLTPDEVRARLIAASAIPGRPPGPKHDPHWGWGLINTARLSL